VCISVNPGCAQLIQNWLGRHNAKGIQGKLVAWQPRILSSNSNLAVLWSSQSWVDNQAINLIFWLIISGQFNLGQQPPINKSYVASLTNQSYIG
jgi:hypothetical protein